MDAVVYGYLVSGATHYACHAIDTPLVINRKSVFRIAVTRQTTAYYIGKTICLQSAFMPVVFYKIRYGGVFVHLCGDTWRPATIVGKQAKFTHI